MRTIRCLILLAFCFTAFDSAAAQQPVTVVAVGLKSTEFTVLELK